MKNEIFTEDRAISGDVPAPGRYLKVTAAHWNFVLKQISLAFVYCFIIYRYAVAGDLHKPVFNLCAIKGVLSS